MDHPVNADETTPRSEPAAAPPPAEPQGEPAQPPTVPGMGQIPGFQPPVPLTPPDPAEEPNPVEEPDPEPAWGSAPLTTPDAPVAPLPLEEEPDARPCTRCGGPIAADGYCEACGEPAVSERDHGEESPAGWVAGVCDRGIRHHRNEDAMGLLADTAPGSFAVLVVCDGVSTAAHSDVASKAAAGAALAALGERRPHGPKPIVGTLPERMAAWSTQLRVAAARANAAIVDTALDDDEDRASPPSCTFVAAIVDGPLVVTGSIGDSRAYWVPDDGPPAQLTEDDSWAQEMVRRGLPRAAAETSPQAHAITRWLGPDAPDADVRADAAVPDRDGWILVCSDGLWNYSSSPEEIARTLHRVQAAVGTDPLALARGLVNWANDQGGRDNVTVTLARITPTPARPAELPADAKESHG